MNRGKIMVLLATANKTEADKEQADVNTHNTECNFQERRLSELSSVILETDCESESLGLDFSIIDPEYIPSENTGTTENEFEHESVISMSARNTSHAQLNKINHEGQESPIAKVQRYLQSVEPSNMATLPDIATNKEMSASLAPNNSIYIKKPSARERPTICPFCYDDVVTHFPRHLFRHHSDNKQVRFIKSLKSGTKERLALIRALRKQGYFHLKTEKNVLNPVKTSKKPDTEYFVCIYCLGHYCKNLLYKHVKKCINRPEAESNAGKKCLPRSQTFMATINSKNHDFLKTSRIKTEVFEIMRPDNISAVAKSDPLICLYGEALLNKHKRQQIRTVVSNKIREMARLLITLKQIDDTIHGLFDSLKPEMFQTFISATKTISGYDPHTKSFKTPSLALHIGTNLKVVCDIAIKLVIEKRVFPNIKWNNAVEKRNEIKDLRKLIVAHWCSELSSLALKVLNERKMEKPVELPLANDIRRFYMHVNSLAAEAYENLRKNVHPIKYYKMLTECVLAQTIMFNRKRVGDVQYLKITSYNTNSNSMNQEAFTESLTPVENLLSKKFKRVVTGGKGSKPVPILFSKKIQKYIDGLLKARNDFHIVPETNPYLFANPASENRWMSGGNVLRKLANNCELEKPSLLTSSKFRKHIATTLQLLNMEDDEMEQIATFMGHTKKTHAEFYRLPQDIYQTAKVAKILLLLEKGKGKEFRGKNLNEIELQEIYYSSESDKEDEEEEENLLISDRILNRTGSFPISSFVDDKDNAASADILPSRSETRERNVRKTRVEEDKGDKGLGPCDSKSQKVTGRVRWSEEEKRIVKRHFERHIKNKIVPKKHECEELISRNRDALKQKGWVRVKTFVYNTFKNK